MKTEFGREVSHRLLRQIRKFTRKPFIAAACGAVQALHCDFVFSKEIGIASGKGEAHGIDIVQQFYRIMLRVLPKVGIEAFEQEPSAVVPAPSQVVGELFQALNALRNSRKTSCLHLLL